MDPEILKILSEELLETKNMVHETRGMVLETRRMADAAYANANAAIQSADAATRRADASWELVVMTRNQIQEDFRYMRLPWWKKLAGRPA